MSREISIRDFRVRVIKVDDEIRFDLYEQIKHVGEEPAGSWFGTLEALPAGFKEIVK